MKKNIFIILFLLLFIIKPSESSAVYDPLSVPNNKIGIHILTPDELEKSKELVNANGDWGYVTIPIQNGDRDLEKWQNFMDRARKMHLIPIVRLATEGNYFNTSSWSKPKDEDIVDFANFLDSLTWPVKNRYVIIYNEVNRGDEWQGKAKPDEYARILSYSVTVFKSKNTDFFIISSGMDNAASTDGTNFSEYDYFEKMNKAIPGIFNQIDGFSSHSYPNPAFSSPPDIDTPRSIRSFLYETNDIDSITSKKLPVFITETGWDQEAIPTAKIASYYKEAFETVWNNERIVAVTPFLMHAGEGPFKKFSFLKTDGTKNEIFQLIENLPKTRGKPPIYSAKKVLGSEETNPGISVRDFSGKSEKKNNVKILLKLIFRRN